MDNSQVHPPPPPPDFPPPSQSRRSRRSRLTETTKAPQSAEPLEHDVPQSQQGPMTPRHVNSDSQTESKNVIYSMEIDDTIPDAHLSRFPRAPFFTKHAHTDSIDGIFLNNGVSFGETSVDYYGMRDTVLPNGSTESVAGSRSSTLSRFQRIRQGLRSFSFARSPRSADDPSDEDSLSDFKDWTPPDSAYGAAFPICGWVPKHTRRAIEITIIALFVFALVYFVVTTSIRISNDQSSSTASNSESSSNKLSDDDHYIDYDNEYKYMDDDKEDDDYFKEMDDAINAGGDGAYSDDAVGDGAVDDDGYERRFLRPF